VYLGKELLEEGEKMFFIKSRLLKRTRRRRRFKDEMDYISSIVGDSEVMKASDGLIELLERKHHIKKVYTGEFATLYKLVFSEGYYLNMKSS